jgi:hypothetical protein
MSAGTTLMANAGCCMPFRCGVSAMLTLAPVRSAWRRQSAHSHLRLMSRMVTAGLEVVREIRLIARQPSCPVECLVAAPNWMFCLQSLAQLNSWLTPASDERTVLRLRTMITGN